MTLQQLQADNMNQGRKLCPQSCLTIRLPAPMPNLIFNHFQNRKVLPVHLTQDSFSIQNARDRTWVNLQVKVDNKGKQVSKASQQGAHQCSEMHALSLNTLSLVHHVLV